MYSTIYHIRGNDIVQRWNRATLALASSVCGACHIGTITDIVAIGAGITVLTTSASAAITAFATIYATVTICRPYAIIGISTISASLTTCASGATSAVPTIYGTDTICGVYAIIAILTIGASLTTPASGTTCTVPTIYATTTSITIVTVVAILTICTSSAIETVYAIYISIFIWPGIHFESNEK